jgi:hypothetical protein
MALKKLAGLSERVKTIPTMAQGSAFVKLLQAAQMPKRFANCLTSGQVRFILADTNLGIVLAYVLAVAIIQKMIRKNNMDKTDHADVVRRYLTEGWIEPVTGMIHEDRQAAINSIDALAKRIAELEAALGRISRLSSMTGLPYAVDIARAALADRGTSGAEPIKCNSCAGGPSMIGCSFCHPPTYPHYKPTPCGAKETI